MIKYMKPMVLELDDIAEGIYAASGDEETNKNEGNEGGDKSNEGEGGESHEPFNEFDCWTLTVTKDQKDAGGYATFRVDARHSTELVHVSSKTTITIPFTRTVTNAKFEGFNVSWSGNVVTLERENHGNSYVSGDNYNSLLQVWGEDLPNLDVMQGQATICCTREVNVQGGFDNP